MAWAAERLGGGRGFGFTGGHFHKGWGNNDQPAGYSPGSFSASNPLTGSLVDEASWSFDNINNPNFNKNAKPGQKLPVSAITIYAAVYTDYPDNVYFLGRFYRQEPGT